VEFQEEHERVLFCEVVVETVVLTVVLVTVVTFVVVVTFVTVVVPFPTVLLEDVVPLDELVSFPVFERVLFELVLFKVLLEVKFEEHKYRCS